MDNIDQNVLRLTSMEPLDDGGRKFNILYIIAIVLGLFWGMFLDGAGGMIGAIAVTVVLAVTAKACILDWKWKKLRKQKFALDDKVSYDMLIQHLIVQLAPLGFQIEKNVDGGPVITHQKMIYDVNYDEGNTFTIWWRKSVFGAMFDFRTPIHHYRKTVSDMGIIGYTVQQLCCNHSSVNTQQEMHHQNIIVKGEYKLCTKCGAKCRKKDRFCMNCGNETFDKI